MKNKDTQRLYVCIDLKSFYASVESVDRGLDPFHIHLVVADESRGKGAICLAITPALKKLGVPNRCRLFEIPKNISYMIAKPRMKLYMKVSAQIYGILLGYISKDDIHVYSIDEYFLDVTPYLSLYKMTVRQLAQTLINAIFKETGICATAGIGTNLFLAKVALDVLAKHSPDCIGALDENRFKRIIWPYRPIMDIWQIGSGIAKRLEKYKVYDLIGVTRLDEDILYKEFGVNAELLIDHAWGRESCTMADIKNYKSESHSLSRSQILLENYKPEDALLPLREMVDALVLDIVKYGLVTNNFSLMIGYSDNRWAKGPKYKKIPHSGGNRKLGEYTDSFQYIWHQVENLYHKTTLMNEMVRRMSISFNHLIPKKNAPISWNLFEENTLFESKSFNQNLSNQSVFYGASKEEKIQKTLVDIRERFGKNALLKAISLQEKGTAQYRNSLVGGHNGE